MNRKLQAVIAVIIVAASAGTGIYVNSQLTSPADYVADEAVVPNPSSSQNPQNISGGTIYAENSTIIAGEGSTIINPNPNASPTATPPSNSQPVNPTATDKPTSTPTPPPADITIHYTDHKRENLDNNQTKVTYAITATWQAGSDITIHYNNFSLMLMAPRMLYEINVGSASPQNNGVFTLSPSHPTENFQLTFIFSAKAFNGMDTVGISSYQLYYNEMIVQLTN